MSRFAVQTFHRTVRRIEAQPTDGPGRRASFMVLNVLNDNLVPGSPASKYPPTTATTASEQAATNATADLSTARNDTLWQHIDALRPDVLSLVEVADLESFWGPRLESAGYSFVSDRKSSGQRDLTVVAVNLRSGCRLVAHDSLHYNPPSESQFALLACVEMAAPPTMAATEAISASPADSSSKPQRVLVVATHAKAGRTEEMEAVRMTHAAVLHSADRGIPRFQALWGVSQRRTVFMGDFNAGPHSYGGRYPARVVPWLMSPDCPLRWEPGCLPQLPKAVGDGPTMSCVPPDCPFPLFTTCKRREGQPLIVQTLDYILLGGPGGFRVVGDLPCPTHNPEFDLSPGFLPAPFWGSDHLSMYCEAILTEDWPSQGA